MTPTQRPGILHQVINDDVDLIIHIRYQQVIQRNKGRAEIFFYSKEEEIGEIVDLLTEKAKMLS